MAYVIKILTDDYGCPESRDWCAVSSFGDAVRTVCRGEVFGEGEGGATFLTKEDGKVTCERCREIIKWFKSYKL